MSISLWVLATLETALRLLVVLQQSFRRHQNLITQALFRNIYRSYNNVPTVYKAVAVVVLALPSPLLFLGGACRGNESSISGVQPPLSFSVEDI